MRIFISWSGPLSQKVAKALRRFFPDVIQDLEPFFSTDDIEEGAQWSPAISESLEQTSLGIICVTRENQREPWLNFEAGALAKVMSESRVIPLAIDLKLAEIERPLGTFQGAVFSEESLRKILVTLNGRRTKPLDADRLNRQFNFAWPNLRDAVETARRQTGPTGSLTSPARDHGDMLEEILSTVRGIARGGGPGVDRPWAESPQVRKQRAVTAKDVVDAIWSRLSPNVLDVMVSGTRLDVRVRELPTQAAVEELEAMAGRRGWTISFGVVDATSRARSEDGAVE
jgi:hypothetical protein